MRHIHNVNTTKFDFRPGKAARRTQLSPPNLQKPPDTLRLGHLSDFHFGKEPADGGPSEEAVEGWLEMFADHDVDVLVVTGDLVEEPGDRARLLAARQMLDEAPFPHLVIPGNHDVPEPGVPGPFEELFGAYPRLVGERDMEFVLFDSMKGLPVSERSRFERTEARTGTSYSRGKVGDAQMSELTAQLAELAEPPAFGRAMLVHHHLRTNAPTEQGYKQKPNEPNGLMGPLDDARELFGWASEHQVRLIFHGHKHSFWDPYEPLPGVIVLNSGSSTLGKPDRPRSGRLVDVWRGMESIAVHDLLPQFTEPKL